MENNKDLRNKIKISWLLASLTEECGEVTKMTGKSLKYGLGSINPHEPKKGDNLTQLYFEMQDVISTWRFICKKLDMEWCDELKISNKDDRLKYWFNYKNGFDL